MPIIICEAEFVVLLIGLALLFVLHIAAVNRFDPLPDIVARFRAAEEEVRSRREDEGEEAELARPRWQVIACVEIKFYGTFVLNRRVSLHAIDAMPARWRGDAGSSPLDGASTVGHVITEK